MDLDETIKSLRTEKEKLDGIITVLEQLKASTSRAYVSQKRSGRKSMSQYERRQVSERMTAYWAQRRKQRQNQSASTG